MRTVAAIAATLLCACLLTGPAMAQTAGDQDAPRQSGLRAIPKDQRAQAQEMLYAFKDEIQALNVQIQETMGQMDAQFKGSTLNESRIRALAAEIMALRSTVYKKTVEFRIEFHKTFGVLPF